jgi:HK97 family phage portal protein
MGVREHIARWLGPAPERRAAVPSSLGWGVSVGTPRVDAILAENLSTVTACVQAIASGIACLPARLYRSQGEGRAEVVNHPVARLLRQPNPRQTWPDFCEMLVGEVLLHGNGLAAIETDTGGQPTNLMPIPWRWVQPLLLPNGGLAFDVMQPTATGQRRRYLSGEVLHLKDRSDDGLLGKSRISRAPSVLQNALGVQEFVDSVWRSAAQPSGMFTLPPNITADGVRRMEAWFSENYFGGRNAGRPLFVDPDSKFTPIALSPADTETLASRRFGVEEIARLFNVPSPLINDLSHSTFTNSETTGRWFGQFTLGPWCRKIEAEFQRSVIGDATGELHIEIDLSALMRGSYVERWQANVAAVQAGILMVNEVRELEGFNPLPIGSSAASAG